MAEPAAFVDGIVVEGDRRGRELGFPTANVAVAAGVELPADGVYAGWLSRANGTRHPAAVSVGLRPTYYGPDGARLVEAYVLDFDEDLYGERVRVEVVRFVRGQVGFASSEELIEQMISDVAEVRRLVGDGEVRTPS